MLRQIEGRRMACFAPAIALASMVCWTETANGATLPLFEKAGGHS